MTDIVERLRKVFELRGDTYSSYEVIGMVSEAAYEIERLRSNIECLERALAAPCPHCGELA